MARVGVLEIRVVGAAPGAALHLDRAHWAATAEVYCDGYALTAASLGLGVTTDASQIFQTAVLMPFDNGLSVNARR